MGILLIVFPLALGRDTLWGLVSTWHRWRSPPARADGAEKGRWTQPLDPRELFDLIDAMPMRQRWWAR